MLGSSISEHGGPKVFVKLLYRTIYIRMKYSEIEDKIIPEHGVDSALGLATPALLAKLTLKRLFITLNISPKQRMYFNRHTTLQWRDYKVLEQAKIISRYRRYLDGISSGTWEIHFEYTRDMNIHIHCIVSTNEHIKDVIIGSKRFFDIPTKNRGFVDIREVYDNDTLRDYLMHKDKKGYQTTGIAPIYNDTDVF